MDVGPDLGEGLLGGLKFFARHKHPIVNILWREGDLGACMNSHAVGPRSTRAAGLTRGSLKYKPPAARCLWMLSPRLGRP